MIHLFLTFFFTVLTFLLYFFFLLWRWPWWRLWWCDLRLLLFLQTLLQLYDERKDDEYYAFLWQNSAICLAKNLLILLVSQIKKSLCRRYTRHLLYRYTIFWRRWCRFLFSEQNTYKINKIQSNTAYLQKKVEGDLYYYHYYYIVIIIIMILMIWSSIANYVCFGGWCGLE